jgi:urocanate hydratase
MTTAAAPDTRTDAELDALVEQLVGDLSNVHAPTGTELLARGWEQEAALRMLCNNLDPDVAEEPTKLVVYASSNNSTRH